MAQIRLTKKLQVQMGLKPSMLSEIVESPSPLDAWYANIFHFERRKAVLFMNENTLFQFFYFGWKKKEFLTLSELFVEGVKSALVDEKFSPNEISNVMAHLEHVEFTGTNSRKALGHMNDSIFQCCVCLSRDLYVLSREEITRKLNRVPQVKLEHTFPLDEFAAVIGNRTVRYSRVARKELGLQDLE